MRNSEYLTQKFRQIVLEKFILFNILDPEDVPESGRCRFLCCGSSEVGCSVIVTFPLLMFFSFLFGGNPAVYQRLLLRHENHETW